MNTIIKYKDCPTLTAAARSCKLPLEAFTKMLIEKELITLDRWVTGRDAAQPDGTITKAVYRGHYIVNAPTPTHGIKDKDTGITYPLQRVHPEAVEILLRTLRGMTIAERYRLTLDKPISWSAACKKHSVSAKGLTQWLSTSKLNNGKTRFINGYPQSVGFSHGYFVKSGDSFMVTPSGYDWLSVRLPQFRKAGFRG